MERLTIPWIDKDRSQRQVRGTNQGGGKLGLSSILMGAHIEDTVVPNLLLGSIGLHIYVQGPGVSEGQEAASFQLFGVAVAMLGECIRRHHRVEVCRRLRGTVGPPKVALRGV